ncbi:hypothetical protein AMS68_005819 [Peltaster fructicola]|uniref:N-acetyltransferase domain-containing protein n=1 Tax=Peltaster fructicola TaxID=286661 RepID=A0A6H0XZV0_9PEZI|nr:hypothetical protein AMS68_005819 [Peltaster fructicola]
MPRDLFFDHTATLSDDQPASEKASKEGGSELPPDELHTFAQLLTVKDADSCTKLEEAAFPPEERATHAKFIYRLKTCPEVCLGLFTSSEDSTAVTAATSRPIDSDAPARKAILLGHIVSTRTTHSTVSDEDMAYPTDANPDPKLGHKEHGRTVCLHSLAVLPGFQKQKLGTTLMRAYIKQIQSQDVADRIALIAHDYLIAFYEKFGFKSLGPSKAQFGGGGWYDMVLELKDE